jgi:TPR repeat protein
MESEDTQAVTKFSEYLDAAKIGDLDALREVAKCYYYGEGVAIDKGESLRWCRLAAEKGDPFSQWMLGSLFYLCGESVDRDDALAAKWLSKSFISWLAKAELGDVEAQCAVARMLLNAEGVQKDTDEAIRWLRIAADNGSTWSMYFLAEAYFFGIDVLKNHDLAMALVLKYAEQGGAKSWGSLAYLAHRFEYGYNGVQPDCRVSIRLLRIGASYGDARCYSKLGDFLYNGVGTEKDDAGALECWRKGAELGHADSQFSLGDAYAAGQLVDKDFGAALYWYLLASEAGVSDRLKACHKIFQLPGADFFSRANSLLEELLLIEPQDRIDRSYLGGYAMLALGDSLGRMSKYNLAIGCFRKVIHMNAGYAKIAWVSLGEFYADGIGVPRDQAEAFNCWSKAARLGHSRACYELGLSFQLSRGVGEDLVEVYAWFSNAYSLGYDLSGAKIIEIEDKLNQVQLNFAQSRSTSLNRLIQESLVAEKRLF